MNIKLTGIQLISLSILFLAVCACRKSPTPNSTVVQSNAASSQSQSNHPEGGVVAAAETKYFKGSIGNALDLQMKLMRTGEQLNGSYYYQKIGTKIDLRGTVNKDGNLVLEEFDRAGKQSGVFKGIWRVDGEDGLVTIAGNWSKPPGDKNEDKKTAFSIHEEPITLSGDADVVTKQIKESNKKLVYEIAVQYPQITGSGNPNFEKFNQVVRGSVAQKVAEFKKDMAPQTGQQPRPENSMGSDMDINYKIMLAQDDLVSISFAVSSYYQGAAHPNSSSEVVNYDLKNGKSLKLADLFKPGAKYLQAISNYCVADLKKQSKQKGSGGMLDDTSINSGAAPTPKNYQSWTIMKKGLGVTFDAYQVAPYAAGPQFVTVPYSAIKDLINLDGPIGQFAK
jgi:Protein of unknown function (DUF3298)/Deacetylase PdaC